MWYVIQVINGREDVMRERIERMVPAGAMQELFYPQYQTEIKVHGEWVNTTKLSAWKASDMIRSTSFRIEKAE